MPFYIEKRYQAVGNRGPKSRVSLNRVSPQAKDILHYWPIFQGHDAGVEDLVSGNNLTPVGTGNVLAPKYDVGYGQKALGKTTNQRALQLDSSVSFAGTDNYTIAMRIRRTPGSTANNGMAVGDQSSASSYVWIREGADLRFKTSAQTYTFSETDFSTSYKTIVLTVAPVTTTQTVKLYVDGKLSQSITGGVQGTYTVAQVFDGYTAWALDFDGDISWVGLWNRTWTESDVWQNYAPQTRFDLLLQPTKKIFLGAAAAPAGTVPPIHYHHRHHNLAA